MERTIRVYSLPGCPAPESADLHFEALGPFSATNLTAEELPIGGAGRELRFPLGTRAVTALAVDSEDSNRRFIGYGEAFESGDVELVLWPEAESCTVFDQAETAGFPSRGGGQALGYAPSSGLLLAAGGNDRTSSAVVGALSFDVRSGSAYAVDASQRHVMGEPRAFATVTEFGDKLLVAGGENPIHDVPEAERILRDTAEVYDPVARRFELDLIELRDARTRHAALVLPSGETLLVGGRDAFGGALATLEVVTPATHSSSVPLDPLTFGRIEPVVLRLTDGRIFVGGGYDAAGEPVPQNEWLSRDADELVTPETATLLPARLHRAFVAMPGGAVLATDACDAAQGCDCSAPQTCDARSFWIDSEGNWEELDEEPRDTGARPLLLPGSDGSPWLFTGTEVLRFNPFRARFERARTAPADMPPVGLAAPVSVAPDHFFWINDAEAPALIGVRAGLRERYVRDVALIAASIDDPRWPLHLAPDRNPLGKLRFEGVLHFDGPPVKVFITDALYDLVEISVTVDGPSPSIAIGEEIWPSDDCISPKSCTIDARGLPLGLSAPDDGRATSVLAFDVSRR